MEKPISYLDWKLHFRNNHFPKTLTNQSCLNSLNEFKVLLRNFCKRDSIIKSAGILSSQINFKTINLIDGNISCTLKISSSEIYQININKEKKYIDHNCQEFLLLNKFKKYFCSHLIRLFFLLKENDTQNTVKLLKHISTHDYNFFPNFKQKNGR